MEEEYSAAEKQQVLEQIEKEQKRLYQQGKIIVYVIAIINIIGAVVSAFTNFNFITFITLIVQIALSLALLCGVTWVRYLFAIGLGLSGFLALYLLSGQMDFSGQLGMVIYLVLTLIYAVASCIILFVSKSVSEFLYAQKNR